MSCCAEASSLLLRRCKSLSLQKQKKWSFCALTVKLILLPQPLLLVFHSCNSNAAKAATTLCSNNCLQQQLWNWGSHYQWYREGSGWGLKRGRAGNFLTVADTEFQTPGAIKRNGSSRPDSKVSLWDIVNLFCMQLTRHEVVGGCRGRRKDTDGIIKNGDCARYSQWKEKELMSYGGKDLENGRRQSLDLNTGSGISWVAGEAKFCGKTRRWPAWCRLLFSSRASRLLVLLLLSHHNQVHYFVTGEGTPALYWN